MTQSRSIRTRIPKFSIQINMRVQAGHERGSIIFIVYCKSERLRFPSGYNRISPADWDDRRQRMKGSCSRFLEINEAIDSMVKNIYQHYTAAIQNGEEFSVAKLQSVLFPDKNGITSSSSKRSIVRLFKRFAQEHTNKGRLLSKNTVKSYYVVLNSWKAFEHYTTARYTVSDFLQSNMNATRARKILESYQR
ncbi:MAG: hypothetical protein HQ472_02485, partial [Ignavibacteria bacterium]|nr:hypothetical protein [Ignavibacteria bacterium]